MSNEDIKLAVGVIVASLVLVIGIVAVGKAVDTPDEVEVSQVVGPANHVKGNSEAEHTIVEFADFQCPACKAAHPGVERFMNDYGTQVRFVYRHFPIPGHQNARPAAYAAEAAAKQDAFWQVYDWLFNNQGTWQDAEVDGEYFYEAFGEEFELEREQFLADYESSEAREAVANDVSAAREFGVNSTPTFFVNGKKVTGANDVYGRFVEELNLEGVTPSSTSPTALPSPTPEG